MAGEHLLDVPGKFVGEQVRGGVGILCQVLRDPAPPKPVHAIPPARAGTTTSHRHDRRVRAREPAGPALIDPASTTSERRQHSRHHPGTHLHRPRGSARRVGPALEGGDRSPASGVRLLPRRRLDRPGEPPLHLGDLLRRPRVLRRAQPPVLELPPARGDGPGPRGLPGLHRRPRGHPGPLTPPQPRAGARGAPPEPKPGRRAAVPRASVLITPRPHAWSRRPRTKRWTFVQGFFLLGWRASWCRFSNSSARLIASCWGWPRKCSGSKSLRLL